MNLNLKGKKQAQVPCVANSSVESLNFLFLGARLDEAKLYKTFSKKEKEKKI